MGLWRQPAEWGSPRRYGTKIAKRRGTPLRGFGTMPTGDTRALFMPPTISPVRGGHNQVRK